MSPGQERRITDRWPRWFQVDGDIQHTLMPLGFQCGDGWFSLIWKLCEDLDPLVAELKQKSGVHFEILEVKEKFGQLRMYPNHRTSPISKRIGIAEAESLHTCEVCGQPGRLRGGNWVQTLCDRCWKAV